jgi:hypothetical protein
MLMEKILANFRKMLTRKMFATLPKNIDEKFRKMLTKKCRHTPKNVDEKML